MNIKNAVQNLEVVVTMPSTVYWVKLKLTIQDVITFTATLVHSE